MSSTEKLSFRSVNEKRSAASAPSPSNAGPVPSVSPYEQPSAETAPPATGSGLPFDPVRMVSALWMNARWIALAGFVLASLGAALGILRFRNLYTASTSLIRQELPNTFQASETGEAFKPKQLAVGTLVSVLRSPELLKKVSEQTHPTVSPGMLSLKLTITPERNTDVIRIEYEGANSAEATADLLGIYGRAVVQLTCDLQAQEASQVNRALVKQLVAIDAELAKVGKSMLDFSRETQLVSADKETDAYLRQLGELSLKYETMRIDFETIDLKLASLQNELDHHNPAAAKLKEARAELNKALERYTEAHPVVADQRARVAALEKEMKDSAAHPIEESQLANSAAGTSLYLEIVELKAQKQTLASQLEKLAQLRDAMQAKLSALPEKSVQLARMKARQQSLETARIMLGSRQREAQMFADSAPGYYRVLAAPAAQDVGVKSRWPKVLLVTFALGLVGAAGVAALVLGREALDERIKTARDLSRVAKLPVILRMPPLGGVSPVEMQQWGFRAWLSLAGGLRTGPNGALILGVLSGGRGEGSSTLIYQLAGAAAQRGHNVVVVANREPAPSEFHRGALQHPLGDILDEPRAVFAGVDSGGSWIHLLTMDTSWKWTREQRQRWSNTLLAWRAVRSLVVLMELPASADPETLLLAETVPNLLWLGTESSDAAMIRRQSETLHGGKCHVIGAAFNQRRLAPGCAWLAKWGASLALAALCSIPALAGETASAPRLASWQERLTLGAGDTLNLSSFGRADSMRADVPIGPDGKISYLEAHDITAAGLTIDELRAALDCAFAKFYRNAHTIVTPGVIRSKQYYMLGAVVDKGVFTLDRPLTILEAVSRSRGLETGLFQQNTVELADLPRAFLSRHGRRMPVDFERLFQKGDVSQNLPLEPEDYLYFPSSNTNEVYVLGSVKAPGVQGFTPNATVISMISARGGFTENAYLDRVLVVRGSLSHPRTFVVNARKILKARSVDFALEPKDIVFISDKPWTGAEELVDVALRTFVQAAAAGWASGNIGPLITTPIIPSIR